MNKKTKANHVNLKEHINLNQKIYKQLPVKLDQNSRRIILSPHGRATAYLVVNEQQDLYILQELKWMYDSVWPQNLE